MLFYSFVSQENVNEVVFLFIHLPVADHQQLPRLAAWYLHYVTKCSAPE